MNEEPAICVEGLVKSFGDVRALDGGAPRPTRAACGAGVLLALTGHATVEVAA
jgi:hypothetical protein